MNQQELENKILALGKIKSIVKKEELLNLGVTEADITQFLSLGLLNYSTSTTYRPMNADFTEQHTRVEVAVRFPDAVLCLATALNFHNLTTQLPGQVWVAVPPGSPRPIEPDLPIKVIYMPNKIYSQGIETHIIEGIPLKAYSIAKTVVDCFDFRSEIGMDVALESLEESLRTQRCTADEIQYYAQTRNFDYRTQEEFDEALANPNSIHIFI